jgi:uncharacterized protein
MEKINVREIIDFYYPKDDELKKIYNIHAEKVTALALEMARKHPELDIDMQFVEEAAMLHDIGVVLCDAPRIHCLGTHQYIEHGYLGAEILRQEGLPKHAAVAERHTGTGITIEQIVREDLPIPLKDYSPRTLEEKLICYADKLYSKTKLNQEKPYSKIRLHLWKYGSDTVARFDEMQNLFESLQQS